MKSQIVHSQLTNYPNEETSYALKASLMLMKRYKAGSQMSAALWHAVTHDWPSREAKRRRALRGGQDGQELALEAQVRMLEFGRRTKGPGGVLSQDEFTGGNGASGEQKSCRFKDKVTQISNVFSVILQTLCIWSVEFILAGRSEQ